MKHVLMHANVIHRLFTQTRYHPAWLPSSNYHNYLFRFWKAIPIFLPLVEFLVHRCILCVWLMRWRGGGLVGLSGPVTHSKPVVWYHRLRQSFVRSLCILYLELLHWVQFAVAPVGFVHCILLYVASLHGSMLSVFRNVI